MVFGYALPVEPRETLGRAYVLAELVLMFMVVPYLTRKSARS